MAIECNAKINKKNDIAGKNYRVNDRFFGLWIRRMLI